MTQQERKRISKADELPSHSYAVDGSLSQLLLNADAFRPLADAVAADLQQDLTGYLIEDRVTIRAYHRTLLQIAMMGRLFGEAERHILSIKALEDKEAAQLMCGAMESAIIAADAARAESAFSDTFAAMLGGLPVAKVISELKAQKRRLEILSPELYLGVVTEQLEPAVIHGHASLDIMRRLIEFFYLIHVIRPFREPALRCLTAVLDANRTSQIDIWPERDVVVENDALTPVVMGIWDSGTDLSLFTGQVCGDPEAASIAWTWDSIPSTGCLRPISLPLPELKQAKLFMKGSNDMRADVDSPEASALRRKLSTLARHEVKPFMEGLGFYKEYGHGTHVAGIAVRGNPAVRLLVSRIEWPYRMTPPAPTLEWADGHAQMIRASIAFSKSRGARIVNMSWSITYKTIESELKMNANGMSIAECEALAGRIFSRLGDAFRTEIAEAPDILFIVAAGNTNTDVRFVQEIPVCFDLPNLISVGAVDCAGNEAPFTAFGKIDVYANGYCVDSFVPGGDRQAWSGTSMAAPQVANLAGKLLAKYPHLTTAELRSLILDTATSQRVATPRQLCLLHPRRAFELAARRTI